MTDQKLQRSIHLGQIKVLLRLTNRILNQQKKANCSIILQSAYDAILLVLFGIKIKVFLEAEGN